MTRFQRFVGIVILLALLALPAALFAQDAPVTVVGSGQAIPLFESLVSASGATPELAVEVTGSRVGLERFCQGTAGAAVTSRAMTDAEAAACVSTPVEYLELLLGDYALALIGNPADAVAECIPVGTFTTMFAPSAAGVVTNWRAFDTTSGDLSLSLALPPADSAAYALLDGLVEGEGLRTDAALLADDAAIIAQVAATPGALGLVNYTSAVSAEGVRMFEIGTTDGACIAPSVESVENGQYPLTQRLFAYVTTTAAAQPAMAQALTALGAAEFSTRVSDAGFLAPNADALAANADTLANLTTGRTFSIPPVVFTIDPTTVGTLSIGGDGAGSEFMTALTSGFQQVVQGVTSAVAMEGRVAAVRRFCNGELDAMTLTAPLTEEQLANCTANNITPYSYDLGSQAVVMVVGSAAVNEPLFCLTPAQIGQIWGAGAEQPTNWSQVDPAFPDLPMTLLTPSSFSDTADILLTSGGAVTPGLRTDGVISGDPLYRAASVAVVDGAMTFMSWREYIRVLENAQQNIRVVRVDNGTGCVLPDINTIRDGSYAVTRPLEYVVSSAALARPEVQSFTWYLFEDAGFAGFEQNDLHGLEVTDLPAIREELQTRFDEIAAAAAAAAATPEVTPEATAAP